MLIELKKSPQAFMPADQVGAPGFEPGTSRTQTVRAIRTAPRPVEASIPLLCLSVKAPADAFLPPLLPSIENSYTIGVGHPLADKLTR
jgi:hypothetical protein